VKMVGITVSLLQVVAGLGEIVELDASDGERVEVGVMSTFDGRAGAQCPVVSLIMAARVEEVRIVVSPFSLVCDRCQTTSVIPQCASCLVTKLCFIAESQLF